MIPHLVISLRKAVDTSLIQIWDWDHFTAVESIMCEMMDSAERPLLPAHPHLFPIRAQNSHLVESMF